MISDLVEEILEIVGDGIQWKIDLVSLTGLIMRLVQQKRELKGKGPQKKRAVEMILQALLEKSFFNEEQSILVSTFILDTMPLVIDTLKGLARSISDSAYVSSICCWG